MNILSSGLKEHCTPIAVKNCREIRFSNGGHLIAAAVG